MVLLHSKNPIVLILVSYLVLLSSSSQGQDAFTKCRADFNFVIVFPAPDYSARRIGTLPCGRALEIDDSQGDWVFIRDATGTRGWVLRSYLDIFVQPRTRHNEVEPEVGRTGDTEGATAIFRHAGRSVVTVFSTDVKGRKKALGTGFVVGKSIVVTNFHVIEDAEAIYVRELGSARERAALLLRSNRVRDIALLSVPALTAPALNISSGVRPEIGTRVYAIGNPEGLEATFSDGLVSGYRQIKSRMLMQITVPISHGSSGGPVLDRSGNVVGIAVASLAGGQNLNFAIPIADVTDLLAKLEELP